MKCKSMVPGEAGIIEPDSGRIQVLNKVGSGLQKLVGSGFQQSRREAAAAYVTYVKKNLHNIKWLSAKSIIK